MKLFLCEKHSQAESIAAGLGNPKRQKDCIQTDQGNVVWASGHLLELNMPEDYDPGLKYNWNFETLPILPKQFLKKVKSQFRDRLKAIGYEIKKAQKVVISTDAGREGEMIAREILEYFNYKGEVERLWASAMDVKSVKKALNSLKPGEETVTLHYAAEARSQADWIVGINLSRALTIIQQAKGVKGAVSVGRVQTPTLALVVYRDREIKNFKPYDYYELTAFALANQNQLTLRYSPKEEERILEKEKIEKLAKSLEGLSGALSVEKKEMSKQPPRPFSLLKLQQKANNLLGWSASKTLKIAQALYETHKVTSYPRTDCDYLPEEQIDDIQTILNNLASLSQDLFPDLRVSEDFFNHLKENVTIRKSIYNTAKVIEHHAIVPTLQKPSWNALSEDEQSLYQIITQNYLANHLDDYRYLQTKISLSVQDIVFSTIGNVPTELGWRAIFNKIADDDKEEEKNNLPEISDGTIATIQEIEINAKQTKPPEFYTEASLLEDMDKVAKFVTDPEKKAKLKDKGIGTSATRDAIIETLKFREFIMVKGKKLLSTDKGRDLIELLEKELPALVDVGETALWEQKFSLIQQRELTVMQFTNEIGSRVKEYLSTLNSIASTLPQKSAKNTAIEAGKLCPRSNKPILDYGDYWKFPGYPNTFFNKEVCRRSMSLEDYLNILSNPDGFEFHGFFWQKSKKVGSAKLRLNQKINKIEFNFDQKSKVNEVSSVS